MNNRGIPPLLSLLGDLVHLPHTWFLLKLIRTSFTAVTVSVSTDTFQVCIFPNRLSVLFVTIQTHPVVVCFLKTACSSFSNQPFPVLWFFFYHLLILTADIWYLLEIICSTTQKWKYGNNERYSSAINLLPCVFMLTNVLWNLWSA